MSQFYVCSPLGCLEVQCAKGRVTGLHWARRPLPTVIAKEDLPVRRALRDYFRGAVQSLDNVPVDISCLTPFQRRVLTTLRRVPAGRTVAYGELARRIGRPRAARAIGTAMRTNPIALVLPCHRVVNSDGGLGNYSGLGGSALKERLLAFEAKHA